MTIGDVLAVIAGIGMTGVCIAATLIFAALAFPGRTTQAATLIAAAPGRCALRGLGIFVGVSLVAIILRQSHAGPVRLAGAALWTVLAIMALVGGAGMARLIGERIQSYGTLLTPFGSVTRGAALCVLAGLLPGVGWFIVTPAAALVALGAITTRTREERREATQSLVSRPLGLEQTP